jgi:YggT family protein
MASALLLILLILDRAAGIYMLVIVVRAIMSWFRPNPRHPVVRFLYAVTDPVLHPVRDLIHYRLRVNLGGIDVSPLVVIAALWAVRAVIIPWLISIVRALA